MLVHKRWLSWGYAPCCYCSSHFSRSSAASGALSALLYATRNNLCGQPARTLPCPIFNAAIDVDDDDDDGDGNGNAAKCNNLIAACQAEATQVQHENEGGGAAAAARGERKATLTQFCYVLLHFFAHYAAAILIKNCRKKPHKKY